MSSLKILVTSSSARRGRKTSKRGKRKHGGASDGLFPLVYRLRSPLCQNFNHIIEASKFNLICIFSFALIPIGGTPWCCQLLYGQKY